MSSVSNTKSGNYVKALREFEEFEGTVSLNGVKNRFDQFTAKLYEVRFHPLFQLEDAIAKLTEVIQVMPRLSHNVQNMWDTSPKGQAHLSKVIKTVKEEMDEFKPKAKDRDDQKDAKRDKVSS